MRDENQIELVQSETPPVPYIVHESDQARLERQIKRLWIALIVAIIVIFICNASWLYAWLQYDYVSDTHTVESQGGGNANFIGNDGDINNGENRSKENLQNKEDQQLP